MSSSKTTLLSHIFNEEYLLPFWLQHHKDMFDDIIIIDYNSTDKSIEICKKICPECKIIKSRNETFDANNVDKEIMNIENEIEGIKIVLNTTEFLLCEIPVKELFMKETNQISYEINCISPYSNHIYNINNNYELFSNLLNTNVSYHKDRYTRFIHNFSNGNYTVGRHNTHNNCIKTNQAHVIWFGYYPMNNFLLKRKLQIQEKMSQFDKDHGLGFQHLYDKLKIFAINKDKFNTGIPLKDIDLLLYNLVVNHVEFLNK